MDGRFTERETGAEYYVRELPDGTIAWVGETSPGIGVRKAFTNVFFGRKVSTSQAQGDLIDVPKGRSGGVFRNLQVALTDSGFQFNLPGVGRRTLVAPETDFPINDSFEWGAGFYDEATNTPPYSLTGVWRCSDGGTYYIRQVGNIVVWFGEHPSMRWSNVFFGELVGNRISGRWVDVPKSSSLGRGEIQLELTNMPLLNPLRAAAQDTRLERIRVTGGFGGRIWDKTDSVRVAFRLKTLTIVRNADIGGVNPPGDEPYLIPLHFTISGNQYTNPADLIPPGGNARPLATSPLLQHQAWSATGEWPKNNLTWRENLLPGTVLAIPDYISYGETELRTLPGLQPNSALARDIANYVPGIVAVEEASTRNEDIRAGFNALLENAPDVAHQEIINEVGNALSSGMFNPSNPTEGVRAALTNLMIETLKESALSDLSGILGGLDPDKSMGTDFTRYSLARLRDESALPVSTIPIEMDFEGGANGLWRVAGTISATLGPAHFANEIHALEITFETGEDDKREDSTVEIEVSAVGGNRGPFLLHSPGERFADRTLHTAQIDLNPPLPLGNQRDLLLRWQRGPAGFPRGADSWELKRLRVVAFDRFNRRRILLDNQSVGTKFKANRTLTVPLPRG